MAGHSFCIIRLVRAARRRHAPRYQIRADGRRPPTRRISRPASPFTKNAALRKHGRPHFLMKYSAMPVYAHRAISDARPFAAGRAIARQRATSSPLPAPRRCQENQTVFARPYAGGQNPRQRLYSTRDGKAPRQWKPSRPAPPAHRTASRREWVLPRKRTNGKNVAGPCTQSAAQY